MGKTNNANFRRINDKEIKQAIKWGALVDK